jgi:hypothetical protein
MMSKGSYTEKYVRDCNGYLNGLEITDNELIRAGCEVYPEDLVVCLVYDDDVDAAISQFCM